MLVTGNVRCPNFPRFLKSNYSISSFPDIFSLVRNNKLMHLRLGISPPKPLAKIHNFLQSTTYLYKKNAKFYVILAEKCSYRQWIRLFFVILWSELLDGGLRQQENVGEKEAEGYKRPPTVTRRNRRGTKGSRRGREGIGGLRNVPDDDERPS